MLSHGLDPRIDRELLDLALKATKTIPEFFDGTRIKLEPDGLPSDCSNGWLAYLAAEAYGYADAAFIGPSPSLYRSVR